MKSSYDIITEIYKDGVLIPIQLPLVKSGPKFLYKNTDSRDPRRSVYSFPGIKPNPDTPQEVCTVYSMYEQNSQGINFVYKDTITCYDLNTLKIQRGPFTIENLGRGVKWLFQREGGSEIYLLQAGLLVQLDSALTQVKQQKYVSPFVELIDSKEFVVVMSQYSEILVLDEKNLAFISTGQKLIEGQYSINGFYTTCQHFTDGRKLNLGGRCVATSLFINLVIDLEYFTNPLEQTLVKEVRRIW